MSISSDLLTVKLEKFVYGGDALGRVPDPQTGSGDRVVFVPFALPGETVSVRVTEQKRGHLRAGLVEVLHPSPERIPPKCRHFGVCGGCAYQQLSYPAQLQVKTGILRRPVGPHWQDPRPAGAANDRFSARMELPEPRPVPFIACRKIGVHPGQRPGYVSHL